MFGLICLDTVTHFIELRVAECFLRCGFKTILILTAERVHIRGFGYPYIGRSTSSAKLFFGQYQCQIRGWSVNYAYMNNLLSLFLLMKYFPGDKMRIGVLFFSAYFTEVYSIDTGIQRRAKVTG